MLSVFIPDNFIEERTYAINTLLHHYAGIEIEIRARKGQIDYELSWGDKSIIIKDLFFGKTFVGETYIAQDRVPEKIIETTDPLFEQILCIYGHDKIEVTTNKIVSDVDIFAGAFFMLTRWEESFGIDEDIHGRFPAENALVVKNGFILRPIVDEYVAVLKKWTSHLGYNVPNDPSTFKVTPTCDVDIPYYWQSRPTLRLLAGRMWRHKSFKQLREDWATMKEMKSGAKQDPYDTFDYLMTTAEKRHLKFTFHILAGGESKFEGYYDIAQPHIKKLISNLIKRGHDVGLHPSYNAFNDAKKLNGERMRLEKQTRHTISISRQHYLRFAVPETWQHLANAYIKEDSTMGYASEPGFRCGTSKPFPVFDIRQRKQLKLIERPLLIMDVSLRFYKGFTIQQSIFYCSQIIQQVKKHNGELMFLWHNSSLSELDEWTGWNEVLEFLISPSN